MAKKQQQGSVPKRGLVTDTSYLSQPTGALTFALNVVNESEVGDKGWRSNEQSNEACYTLPDGYVPIGQIHIGEHQTLIFSSSQDETLSEIGITDANCVYSTIVRANLGFKIANQISGTYRLRRGCERTFYFSTPTPMIFNMDKLEDFKTDGQWDVSKFKLFKVYEQIPNFETVEILENGILIPGSYNASIQYLDNDLNPTEWITTCEPIKIYNDSTSKEYPLIEGATSIENGVTNFGPTNKSIRFTFSNFDPSYPFYRIAIIESNTGNGLVSAVNFSSPISTDIDTFTYSGESSIVSVGTEEEIIAFNSIIDEVEYIEQIENRLILSKVKGTQINFCNLQKYASRIKADLSLRTVQLNQISTSNPKTSTVNFDGTGYMPGEMYSFGIVYIFDDSSLSPSYHIPGKAVGYASLMSSNNSLEDIPYQDNSCQDVWGVDSEGNTLKNTPVRHHRFPTRAEIAEPLYTKVKSSEPYTLNYLKSNIQGTITGGGTTISYKILYTVNGIPFTYEDSFLSSSYDPLVGLQKNITSSRDVVVLTDIEEDVDGGGFVSVGIIGTPSPATSLVYLAPVTSQELDSDVSLYNSKIMGITFSGIDIPSIGDTNNKKVVGYYIVRNEKTILDSGVITPILLEERGFVAHAHIFPTLADKTRIDKDIFSLIHPEHKFNNREYKNLTEISQEGTYTIVKQSKSSVTTQDVGAGSSYNPDTHKKGSADYDGFSLHTFTRDTEVDYIERERDFLTPFIKGEVFYLNTLNSKVVTDSDAVRQEVYNVSGDNKIGIIQMEEDISDPTIVHEELPYVILKRKLANPYGNFRVLRYFKENKNPIYFDTTEVDATRNGSMAFITNGDSYISPMRYHSAIFNDFRLAKRDTKNGTWKIILGAVLVVVGVAAAIFSGGTSLTISATGLALIAGAGVAAAGYGISAISSGIEANQISKVYQEKYEAGLRDTIQDDDTSAVFANPSDDEMQWTGDVVTNLWFESGVNIGLRNGISISLTDYLDAPDVRATEGTFSGNSTEPNPINQLDSYLLEKLTTIDTENEDGRLYKGYAGAELYFLNKDYLRTNKQKIYYTLGLEYDCCSDCTEDFPHRNHYSEQAFQEELTDNYRTFLPNNYTDIEGEKGTITDVFRIQNNLYIHTEGALWHLPQNVQERVTGDVVSFIGTGSFFSIPPRKVTDDDKESAGTKHNWARMKTANGTFFVSASEGKVFLFDGNSLKPIMAGNDNWFRENLPIQADYDFLISAGVPYSSSNNPSSKYGTGFISAYDTDKERFILTKKDFVFSDRVIGGTDYNACTSDNNFIIFDGYQVTINTRAINGWSYLGIEDCKMKFSKEILISGVINTTIEYEEGVIVADPIDYDKSWTMSYSLEDKEWVSWHSYIPSFYFYRLEEFYSWKQGGNNFWKHNRDNHYQTFYGTLFPHIIEYVDNKKPRETKIWEYVQLQSEASQFDSTYQHNVDKDITFNKMIAYTSKQTTGLLNIVHKIDEEDYLDNQIINEVDSILIDRSERDWTLNDLRDVVVNYNIPFFRKDNLSLKSEYFIDKVLNDNALDYNKDWNDLQSFRDKYLVLRLIFDNFDNTRLVTHFTEEMDNKSNH